MENFPYNHDDLTKNDVRFENSSVQLTRDLPVLLLKPIYWEDIGKN